MTLLSDLPWLHLVDGGARVMPIVPAASGRPVEVVRDPESLARALSALAGHLLLVLPDIHPLPIARATSPDPALLASGRALLWPATNDVTGEVDGGHGLWVMPSGLAARQAEAIIEGHRLPDTLQGIVVPQVAAIWDCGASAEAAFRAGFDLADRAAGARAALSASLGADRPHGPWWGIGACRGLLGGEVDRAWGEERTCDTDADDLHRRWRELARRVRVETGLPVRPMNAPAAAALRGMRGTLIPPALWDCFQRDIAAMGSPVDRLRDAAALACATLWGQPGADATSQAPA